MLDTEARPGTLRRLLVLRAFVALVEREIGARGGAGADELFTALTEAGIAEITPSSGGPVAFLMHGVRVVVNCPPQGLLNAWADTARKRIAHGTRP